MKKQTAVLLAIFLAVVLTACPERPKVLPPPTISIDPGLEPPILLLPGFDGVTPRPVATIMDATGNQADFIANELWLPTDDSNELAAFLTRWEGEVVATFNPVDFGLSGISTQYLIRVNASPADTSKLTADLRKQFSLRMGGVGSVNNFCIFPDRLDL
ncbi:MAG: hypothetical protein IIA70_04620 [Proteobacteria bacterium]|nr:hypothetical protein [Pseudomonadota bacterium]